MHVQAKDNQPLTLSGLIGRHSRPKGFADDCQKYNHAALLGWRVLRYTGDMVRKGEAVDQVRIALLGSLKELTA